MSTIVERIIDGEAWWVDSETGKTYGVCRVITEDQARHKHVQRTARAAKALTKAPIKESDIETTIVRAMELDGWRPFKMEQNFSERKKKRTGEPGMPDHLFIRYWNTGDPRGPVPYTKTRCYNPTAEVLWWEFKRIIVREGRKDKASELDPDQVKWITAERARGALVWVAGVDHNADIAGAALHYVKSGLCRRTELFLKLLPVEERMR